MFVVTAVTILLLGLGIFYLWSSSQSPALETAICQPKDLGERYHFAGQSDIFSAPLQETIVESYTVSLLDNQLSNTVLQCGIIQYPDAKAARQAFATICTDSKESLHIGDEACIFASSAPENLAFRRDIFLVLIRGDIGDVTGPATAVDARLQK